jgi:hypothetical protein
MYHRDLPLHTLRPSLCLAHTRGLTHPHPHELTHMLSLCLSVSPSESLARLYVGGGGAEGGDRDGARLRDARNVPCRTVRGPSLCALARTHTHTGTHRQTQYVTHVHSRANLSVSHGTHTHTLSLSYTCPHTPTHVLSLWYCLCYDMTDSFCLFAWLHIGVCTSRVLAS